MQLNQLEILSYVTIMHWPVTVGSNACSQMYVATNKHSPLAHLHDLIPTLASRRYISDNTSQSRHLIL